MRASWPVVLVAAATLLATSCAGNNESSPAPTGTNRDTEAQEPTTSSQSPTVEAPTLEDFQAEVDASIEVPGFPDFMTFAAGHVWVGNSVQGAEGVDRIDPRTNNVLDRIPGPTSCTVLSSGFGSVWVPSCSDNRVYRLDEKTGEVTARIRVPLVAGESGTAVGEGGMWLVTGLDRISRIDAKTMDVKSFEVAPSAGAVGVGFGSVWVTIFEDGTVQRLDPESGTVQATIEVGDGPLWISVDDNAVWVSNQNSGTATRIDPAANEAAAEIDIGGPFQGGDIAAGDGVVWAATGEGPLSLIDPSTDEVVQQWEFHGADALALGAGSVWVSDHQLETVYRYPLD
jgi:virginiamycin B lyase